MRTSHVLVVSTYTTIGLSSASYAHVVSDLNELSSSRSASIRLQVLTVQFETTTRSTHAGKPGSMIDSILTMSQRGRDGQSGSHCRHVVFVLCRNLSIFIFRWILCFSPSCVLFISSHRIHAGFVLYVNGSAFWRSHQFCGAWLVRIGLHIGST